MAKKATKKKANAPEFTFDDVEALADDINDQALFDDVIEFEEEASVEDVIVAIREVIMDGDECQIFNTDGLSAESFATLEKIGCPAVSEKTEEEEDSEPDEPDDDVEEEEEEEAPEEKPAKKTKKVAKKAAPKKEKKAKAAPKKEKPPKKDTATRSRAKCIADAMKKIGTYDIDEIALEANKIFIEHGGQDSMAQSIYFTRKLVIFAKEFNLAD